MKWRKYEIEILSSFDKEKTERLLRDFLTGAYRAFRVKELTEDKDIWWRCTDRELCCWQSDEEYSKCPNCGGVLEKFYPLNDEPEMPFC